ncbi:Short-chain dehydrogenase [Desulfatibacillum alkenivorans DSM 16219]|uniref:Short-chain dehydrogenase n=1 Tax=Desulfatibacillum alkenivorans DSM 16219 TaxID=1121393 RepID=A0A1M6Z3W2_9BACT|nr:SDR family oxidoreductase [Desulfatibacillum alkenivorans]SHL25043.1 Short-chain dehydrogenase [Desulfatibacillum alkenivorans DSM 16219]
MPGFKNKVAIVTGAGAGIGRALCLELARRGAHVTATDVDADNAEETAVLIAETGGSAEALPLDVTREQDVRKLIFDAAEKRGRLDYMFNNAGISMGGEVRDMSSGHFSKIMDVNLWGVIYGTLGAYEVMTRQGFGHIVNIASFYGLVPLPLSTPYNTSKFAVVGLSHSLRAEAAGLGVHVSVACPGYIKTDLIKRGDMVRSTAEDALALAPFSLYSVSKAAGVIVRGVKRNQGMIVFPLHAKLMWWATRFHPDLLPFASRWMVKRFRARHRSP